MQHCNRTLPAILFFLFAAVIAKAQVASSPFSRFGIGDLYSNAVAQNQGMGGIGISNPTYWYLNSQNPALLTYNRWTVFQAGIQVEKRTASDGMNSQSFTSGNMNYLAMAFPVKRGKWTTSIGLTPYSHVNYYVSYADVAQGTTIAVNRVTKGTGGINQFYWSNGVTINKYLALGIRASYLFGSIVTQSANPFATTTVGAIESTYDRDYYTGLNFTAGAAFHIDSLTKKKDFHINAGLVYAFQSNVNTQHFLRYESKSSSGVTIDSATIVNNQGGQMRLPQNIGVGLSFGRLEKWTVGGDFTYLDYHRYNGPTDGPIGGSTTSAVIKPGIGFRTGFGGEFTPRAEDFTNYFNRVTYRVGFMVEQSPFIVAGNTWTDVGGTFGFSLPVGRISSVDLGFKVGKRGSVSQNSIEEKYFRVYFGITFGDQWFIKRKFD